MRFGGIVLAVLLTLGACTSDPEPKEPKRTPTTSATPTATPPTMPAQAKKNTPEGAAAFVKHYIDVFNYAANTGDVEELSRLSSPKCKGCQSYIKLYRDTYEAGGYFKGSDWVLSKFELERNERTATVFVHAESEPGTRQGSATSKQQLGDAEDSELVFEVSSTSTRHIVLRFERSVP
jgi:hypothetical protein